MHILHNYIYMNTRLCIFLYIIYIYK